MADPTLNPKGPPGGAEAPAPTPDLTGLAQQLAVKHAAGPERPSQKGKGLGVPRPGAGRGTFPEEMARYLSKNGLRTVPVDTAGDPGGPPPGGLAPLPSGPAYVVTPEFVKTCAETLLKGVEAYRCRAVFLKSLSLGADKELAKQLGDEAAAPPGAIAVISLSCAEISQKYDVLAAWSPEVMLVVAATTWIGKDLALHKKLNDLAQLKAQAEKKASPAPASPSQAPPSS